MPPESAAETIVARPFALGLAAALIAAFVLIVALAFADRADRARLEKVQDSGPAPRSR